MDELKKGLSVSLPPAETITILQSFTKQIEDWGLAMPSVEPLVLDFGLGDFPTVGLIEYWIANEFQAGYCGKYLFVFDQQTCPLHRHQEKLETFFIVKGSVMMSYAGRSFCMGPGDVLKVDTNQEHSFTGIGPALLLEVSRPCQVDDNYFANNQIPIGGNYQSDKGD